VEFYKQSAVKYPQFFAAQRTSCDARKATSLHLKDYGYFLNQFTRAVKLFIIYFYFHVFGFSFKLKKINGIKNHKT